MIDHEVVDIADVTQGKHKDLQGMNLRYQHLEKAVLSGINFTKADFTRCAMRMVDLKGSNLTLTNFTFADLSFADFTGADLTSAILKGVEHDSTNFTGVNFTDADFDGFAIRNSIFTNANFKNVVICGDMEYGKFEGATFEGVDLSQAGLYRCGQLLTEEQLRGSNISEVKQDLFDILKNAVDEAPYILSALEAGAFDGTSAYIEGTDLLGMIARLRGVPFYELEGIYSAHERNIESWLTAVNKGDTPASNPFAKLAHEWITEWLAAHT